MVTVKVILKGHFRIIFEGILKSNVRINVNAITKWTANQNGYEKFNEIFSRFKKIYVVEMNDGGVHGYGQLAGVLRARFADPRIQGINKTDALRWKVWEILDRVNEQRNTDAALINA